MSWTVLKPLKAGKQSAPFLMGVSAMPGNCKYPAISLSFAAEGLPEAWKASMAVEISVGSGEHAGKLRLSTEGLVGAKLRKIGAGRRVTLQCRLPEGWDAEKRALEPVKAEIDADNALVITMPPWAGQKRAIAVKTNPFEVTRAQTAAVPATRSVTSALMGDPAPKAR